MQTVQDGLDEAKAELLNIRHQLTRLKADAQRFDEMQSDTEEALRQLAREHRIDQQTLEQLIKQKALLQSQIRDPSSTSRD